MLALSIATLLGRRPPAEVPAGFSPSELFAASEVGVWYDPSDFSTLYQDTAGSTPVTAVEQPVGLMLDKSKGLTLGSELVDTANTAAAWTAYDNNTVEQDGDAVKITYVDSAFGASVYLRNTPTGGLSENLVSGKWYRYVIEAKTNSGSNAVFRISDGKIFQPALSTDFQTFTYTSNKSTTSVQLNCQSMSAGEIVWIRVVSVRELPGNHAVAANNGTARPVLRSRYNLLTYSEQFDNAAWTKSRASILANDTTDPNGTTTADRLTVTTEAAGGITLSQSPTITGLSVIGTAYLKAGDAQWAYLGFNSTERVWFDLVNGLVGTQTGATGTISAVGNGWYRCRIAATATANLFNVGAVCAADNTTSSGSMLNKYAYVWGAQLVADSVFPQNTYQRIADALTYDTDATKFPPYLAFTTDDAMSTASIDFSGTDEMSVFAGVTKNSDAATGTLCELSINIASYAGSFFINAPASASSNYSMRAGGSIRPTAAVLTPFAAPITNVLTMSADISDDTVSGRVNGALVATASGDQGTGNFGNWPLYIGARGGSSLFFNGSLYSLIVRGKTSTAQEIDDTEAWVANKTGVTL